MTDETAREFGIPMTRARVRRFAVAGILTYAICAIAALATARNGFDALGIPLGFDFLAFHEAARLALSGELAAAFDPQVFWAALEEKLPGVGYGYYWLYPPTFAVVILPLGLLPYGAAFWAWTLLGLGAYAGAVWRLSRDRVAVFAALGFPAVWVCAYHGQNGFFVAALFMLAFHGLVKRRDGLAGIAIGLLAIKPHLAVLFPIALAAAGRRRAFAWAAGTAIAFTLGAAMVMGPDYLAAYFQDGARLAARALFETHHWATIASVFVFMKLLGAPTALAWAAHGAVAAAATALVGYRFKVNGATPQTLALLAAASLLISPYVMDYDLIVLAAAGVLIFSTASGGAKGGEAWLALAIAMIPILVVGLGRLGLQIGWTAPALTICLIEWRVRTATRMRAPRAAEFARSETALSA